MTPKEIADRWNKIRSAVLAPVQLPTEQTSTVPLWLIVVGLFALSRHKGLKL